MRLIKNIIILLKKEIGGSISFSKIIKYYDNFLISSKILIFHKTKEVENNRKKKQSKYRKKIGRRKYKKDRNFYRKIVQGINEGILVINASRKIIYINERMAQRFGYTADEMDGKDVREFLDKEARHIQRRKEAQRRQGFYDQYDLKVLTKDGSARWLLVSVSPILDKYGQYTGSLSILTDIQQRKQAEFNLQLQSAALETISDGVIIINQQGYINWINPAYTRLTGYKLEEVAGRHVSKYMPENPDEELYRQFIHHVKISKSWCKEVISKRRDGSYFDEEINIIPVRSPADDGNYLVIVRRDLSERRKAQKTQQHLLENTKKLAAAEMRAQLSRELHDSLAQSIYTLPILAETGKRLIVSGDLQKLAQNQEYIYRVSQQALKEIRLLVYELRPQELEKNGLAGALRQRLRMVEERAGITVQFDVVDIDEIPVSIERELFFIAQEALNNIIKHAQANRVGVKLSIEHNELTLEIIDNGIGIDESRIAFSGIGLLSMHERAEKINAKIDISNFKEQNGTKIVVRLPLKELL